METAICHEVDEFTRLISGHKLYHATPLHYLPSILESNRLVCASDGKAVGIRARTTASRRDRMLGVDGYVHLSFDQFTPLLREKLAKGMPHATLVFDALTLDSELPDETALLPFNTKAWRSRADASPVKSRKEMARVLRAHFEFGRYPSVEYLIEDELKIDHLRGIVVYCERDFELALKATRVFGPDFVELVYQQAAPGYAHTTPVESTVGYINCVCLTKLVRPIPRIEFD